MAIIKIVIKDVGAKGDNFEVHAESFPQITDEQVADVSKLTLAQYAALKIMEFVQNGLDMTASKKSSAKLMKNAHKSNKGLH